MTLERFDYLSDARRELTWFCNTRNIDDFAGVAAVYTGGFSDFKELITNKEINDKLMDYAQTLLDEINKEIESYER